MRTTESCNVLEEQLYQYLAALIDDDLFWAGKKYCRLYRNKSYPSKEGQGSIVFGMSIEIWMPRAKKYSLAVFIQCARTPEHRVEPDEIEKFFREVGQVSSVNYRAIFASHAAFTNKAREFAEANGVALLRRFNKESVKWDLRRPVSVTARRASQADEAVIEDALSRQNFQPHIVDLYMQSGGVLTNAFWDFAETIFDSVALSKKERSVIKNPRGRPVNQVPYVSTSVLEKKAQSLLQAVGYMSGSVSLIDICKKERERSGLRVHLDMPRSSMEASEVLSKISLVDSEIFVFSQKDPNAGQERFSLAHELAHHVLGHAAFLYAESCDDSDFTLHLSTRSIGQEIARMEWQANYLASCILMPGDNFMNDFRRIIRELGIRRSERLFVDDQFCTQKDYYVLTSKLMSAYKVSRQAVTIRLEALDLLEDERCPRPVSSMLKPGLRRIGIILPGFNW